MVGHECVLEIEANIYNVGVWTCISKNGKATDYHVDLHLGNEVEVMKEKFVPSLPIQTNEVQELFNMAEGQLNLGKIEFRVISITTVQFYFCEIEPKWHQRKVTKECNQSLRSK